MQAKRLLCIALSEYLFVRFHKKSSFGHLNSVHTQLYSFWEYSLPSLLNILIFYYPLLVGFDLACAPVRCAHPSFWTLCHGKRGAARPPPIAASLLLIYTPKLSLRPELGQSGVRISFHWAKLHPPELHCILLSYAGAP